MSTQTTESALTAGAGQKGAHPVTPQALTIVSACVFLGLSAACVPPQPSMVQTEVSSGTPELASLDIACDVSSAYWSFSALTTAWTGGGAVVMSADGTYIETHNLPSIEAEADGSGDQLSLGLTVVADWRDVSMGSTTAFNCGTPGLWGVVQIFERDGETLADCRSFGADLPIDDTGAQGLNCAVPAEDTGVTTP